MRPKRRGGLDGGTRAIFVHVSGFYSNNGSLNQGGAESDRQAIVGLSSPYVTVTLGRQCEPVVNFFKPFLAAPQWGVFRFAVRFAIR